MTVENRGGKEKNGEEEKVKINSIFNLFFFRSLKPRAFLSGGEEDVDASVLEYRHREKTTEAGPSFSRLGLSLDPTLAVRPVSCLLCFAACRYLS